MLQAWRSVVHISVGSIAVSLRYASLGLLALSAAVLVSSIANLNAGKDPERNAKRISFSLNASLYLLIVWASALVIPSAWALFFYKAKIVIVPFFSRLAMAVFFVALAHRVYGFIKTYIHEKFFVA